MTERAMMALYDAKHRLPLPNGFWLQKDDDNQWQVGCHIMFLGYNISTNVPCGADGSFDGCLRDFANGMWPRLTDDERKIVEHWRPSPDNPICRCTGNTVCEYHALIEIIDRLTGSRDVPAP